MNLRRKLELIFYGLLACIPPLVALWFIRAFAVDTFISDDFEFMQRFEKLTQGRLDYRLIMQPHNEHRAAIAILLMYAIGSATAYSSLALMYTSWLCQLVSLGLIMAAVARAQMSRTRVILSGLVAAMCLFSLRDSESFLFGSVVTATLSLMFGIASFFVISNLQNANDRKGLLLAATAAFGSTFGGFSSGILAWLVAFATLTTKAVSQSPSGQNNPVQNNPDQNSSDILSQLLKWKHAFLIWALAALVSATLFFTAPGTSSHTSRILKIALGADSTLPNDTANQLLHKGIFLLTLLGSAVHGYFVEVSGTFHLVLIILACILFFANIKHQRTHQTPSPEGGETGKANLLLFGASIVMFSTIATTIIAVVRCEAYDLTCIIATAPRYILLSNLNFIGAYLIAISDQTSLKWLRMTVLILSIALATTGYISGLANSIALGELTKDQQLHTKYLMLSYKQQHNDDLKLIYTDVENLIPTLKDMEKRRWNVFSEDRPPLSSLPNSKDQVFQCTVITPCPHEGNTYFIDRKTCPRFLLGGWAMDVKHARPPADICCNLGDKYVMQGMSGEQTEVLSKGLGRQKLLRSGFRITFDTNKVEPGLYPVSFIVSDSKRKTATTSPVVFKLQIE